MTLTITRQPPQTPSPKGKTMTDAQVTTLVSPHSGAIAKIAGERGAQVTAIYYSGAMSRAERNNKHVARITLRLAGRDWSTKHVARVGQPDARREMKSAIKSYLLTSGCGRISVHLLSE